MITLLTARSVAPAKSEPIRAGGRATECSAPGKLLSALSAAIPSLDSPALLSPLFVVGASHVPVSVL